MAEDEKKDGKLDFRYRHSGTSKSDLENRIYERHKKVPGLEQAIPKKAAYNNEEVEREYGKIGCQDGLIGKIKYYAGKLMRKTPEDYLRERVRRNKQNADELRKEIAVYETRREELETKMRELEDTCDKIAEEHNGTIEDRNEALVKCEEISELLQSFDSVSYDDLNEVFYEYAPSVVEDKSLSTEQKCEALKQELIKSRNFFSGEARLLSHGIDNYRNQHAEKQSELDCLKIEIERCSRNIGGYQEDIYKLGEAANRTKAQVMLVPDVDKRIRKRIISWESDMRRDNKDNVAYNRYQNFLSEKEGQNPDGIDLSDLMSVELKPDVNADRRKDDRILKHLAKSAELIEVRKNRK